MSFKCFLCPASFSIQSDAFVHLKKIHQVKDNSIPIKCLFQNCQKTYLSFKALKVHLLKCEQNKAEAVVII